MSGEAIAAILVAAGTFLSGLILAIRGLSGDRFNRKVTESAALLTGYTEMVANLRKEIKEIREDNTHEIERLQRQHKVEIENLTFMQNQERERWDGERNRLEERIDTLEAQVAAVLFRPSGSRERADDNK